jgi:hypothetical protein
MSAKKILVIEDEDAKFSDIESVLLGIDLISSFEIARARTATEAETMLDEGSLALMVLDISLNISAGSLGPLRGGFANLGGLSIAEKMFMFGQSVKTVVVTGFDYFPAAGARQGSYDLVSLRDIETRASEIFGADLLGCIKYSSEGWESRFAACVRRGLEE